MTDENERDLPPALSADGFRALGHALVDQIADFYAGLPRRAVGDAQAGEHVQAWLEDAPMPETGEPLEPLLHETAERLFAHSLHNGHPRFMGYITSSAAPVGALADLLAAAVNANVGLWDLSPAATEIERQAVRWLGQLIGYPAGGGIMVSGGNVANLLAFYAARKAKASWPIRNEGVYGGRSRLAVYGSRGTHTWIEKAADLSGLGTGSIRWIAVDAEQRMDVAALEAQIERDREAGATPFLVVGTAGTVGTGAIDPLDEIAAICRRHDLWFHVDGAYGAPAAALPEAPGALRGLAQADSVALDPHKWLYCPIEAGCTLVRRPSDLLDAFSFHPEYYRIDTQGGKVNYYEHGIQNTRGFRALKVWLALRSIGRAGYVQLLRDDIALAQRLHARADAHPELEAGTRNLSIATFRYVPRDLLADPDGAEDYLNALNERLVARLQHEGQAFLSNAVVGNRYLLRACIVNFRTTSRDVDEVVELVARLGGSLDRELRPGQLR